MPKFTRVCKSCHLPIAEPPVILAMSGPTKAFGWEDTTGGDVCGVASADTEGENIPHDPGLWLIWRQDYEPQFDDAEFYEMGLVVSVTDGLHLLVIENEGERRIERRVEADVAHASFVTAKDYRTSFPDGGLPTDGDEYHWINNGWFQAYDYETQKAVFDDVDYSLRESIANVVGEFLS